MTNDTIADLLASAVAGGTTPDIASPLVDKEGLAAALAGHPTNGKFDTAIETLEKTTKADKATGDARFAELESTAAGLQATIAEQIKLPAVEKQMGAFKAAGGVSGLTSIKRYMSAGTFTWTKPAGVKYVRSSTKAPHHAGRGPFQFSSSCPCAMGGLVCAYVYGMC